MMRSLCAFLLLTQAAIAQWPTFNNSIYVAPHAGGAIVVFEDLSVLYMVSDPASDVASPEWQTSYSDGASSMAARAQGQVSPPAAGPQLSTQWVDRFGVSHTVTTPVASQTPAGVQRAIDAHNTLVRTMQAAYPPRPNP